MRMTEAVVREADDLGLKQYWSLGNHEERLMRKNEYHIGSMDRIARMVGVGDLVNSGRLVISESPTLLYRDNWLLTHPGMYSSQPLQMPGGMADDEHKNVVTGHAHHWGIGKSPSGMFTVMESGGLFEPKFMRYLQYNPVRTALQCKGFVLLDHGTPHLVDGAGGSTRIRILTMRALTAYGEIARHCERSNPALCLPTPRPQG